MVFAWVQDIDIGDSIDSVDIQEIRTNTDWVKDNMCITDDTNYLNGDKDFYDDNDYGGDRGSDNQPDNSNDQGSDLGSHLSPDLGSNQGSDEGSDQGTYNVDVETGHHGTDNWNENDYDHDTVHAHDVIHHSTYDNTYG